MQRWIDEVLFYLVIFFSLHILACFLASLCSRELLSARSIMKGYCEELTRKIEGVSNVSLRPKLGSQYMVHLKAQ